MQGSAAIAAAGSRIEASPQTQPAQIAASEIPALYLVALAVVVGDSAGQLQIGLPVWVAMMLCVCATTAFLMARRKWAMVLALGALTTASATAAHRIYEPPSRAATIRSARRSAGGLRGRSRSRTRADQGHRSTLPEGSAGGPRRGASCARHGPCAHHRCRSRELSNRRDAARRCAPP